MPAFSRRTALALLSGVAIAPIAPVSFAQGLADRKFVLVILRGAMDGLAALIPNAPEMNAMRGGLTASSGERRRVDATFSLHPAFEKLHGMVEAKEAAFVHACATPYRERSHFDGQDMLETLSGPESRVGWLNRALQVAPGADGLAIGPALPMVLRGKAEASNWSPSVFHAASDDLLDRLAALYQAADPALGAALETARATDMAADAMKDRPLRGGLPYAAYLGAAGRLMAADRGPGVGVVSLDGWDTHANQAQQLSARFAALDEGLAALKTELGSHWKNTVIIAASEFGRTVAENGTRGSDHGTGGLVILAGGGVKGGGVYGDWPGVSTKDLYERRDLYPANDMVSVFKGVLHNHLGLARNDLDRTVFPNSGPPMPGLVNS